MSIECAVFVASNSTISCFVGLRDVLVVMYVVHCIT